MKLKPAPKNSFTVLAVAAFGDIIAVAADWRQANCQVFAYGADGWQATAFQVADFRHSAHQALAHEIREYIAAPEGVSPDEVSEETIDGVISRAEWVV